MVTTEILLIRVRKLMCIMILFASDFVAKKTRDHNPGKTPGFGVSLKPLHPHKRNHAPIILVVYMKNDRLVDAGKKKKSSTRNEQAASQIITHSTFGAAEIPFTPALAGVDVLTSPAAEPGPEPLVTMAAFFSSSPLSS